MALLATLIPDERGICNAHKFGTYGGGTIPRDQQGDLAFRALLNDPSAPNSLETYERTVILLTGGFAD